MRVQAARHDEPASGRSRPSRGRPPRRPTKGPRTATRSTTGRPVSSRDRGLELEHRLQRALRDLGLVGRVGSQELRALGDRVDDRRHVVVVHARAEEADLVLGAACCARRARRGARTPPPRSCRRAARAARSSRTPGGHVREELLDRGDADLGEHRARGRPRSRTCSGSSPGASVLLGGRAAPCRRRRPAARRPPPGLVSLTFTSQPAS